MRAKVLKKEANEQYLMCEDGSFRITKRHKSIEVGQEVKYDKHFGAKIASSVLVFFLVIGGFFGGMSLKEAAEKADYLVYLDINPSVKLLVNKKDEVIKCEPLNDDAKSIAERFNEDCGKNVSLNRGVGSVLAIAYEAGYEVRKDGQDNPGVFITFAGKDEKFCDKKIKKLGASLDNVSYQTFATTYNKAIKNETKGVSIAKLLFAKAVAEAENEPFPEVIKKPVKEITKVIVENPAKFPSVTKKTSSEKKLSGTVNTGTGKTDIGTAVEKKQTNKKEKIKEKKKTEIQSEEIKPVPSGVVDENEITPIPITPEKKEETSGKESNEKKEAEASKGEFDWSSFFDKKVKELKTQALKSGFRNSENKEELISLFINSAAAIIEQIEEIIPTKEGPMVAPSNEGISAPTEEAIIPDNEKQEDEVTPPVQNKDNDAPGQNKDKDAPGQNKDKEAPGQNKDKDAPGQNKDKDAPGQEKKDDESTPVAPEEPLPPENQEVLPPITPAPPAISEPTEPAEILTEEEVKLTEIKEKVTTYLDILLRIYRNMTK